MKAPNTSTSHTSLLLIFCLAVLVSACSGSSGGSDVHAGSSSDGSDVNAGSNSGGSDMNSGSNSDDSELDITVDTIPSDDDGQDDNDINIGAQGSDTDDAPSSTLVTFDVTVPKYVSQALQVKIDWGADDTLASWVVDESWTATGNLQAGSSYAITATFSDDNGAIVLGRAHLTLNTSTDLTQALDISASDFDTQSVDDDGDGVSNLAELNAGTHPLQPSAVNTGEIPPVVDARVELIADKTFRIQWESTSSATYYRVLENVDGSSGYTAVSDELGATVEHFDHRVALYRRVNARYMVEACNLNGCSYSVQQLIESLEGHMEEGVGYLKSETPARSNDFGTSVSVSADGQTLAVGEHRGGIIDNDPTQKAGAVYIFQRANNEWITEQVLLADRGDHADGFGYRVELSADGNTLVVGAPGEDSTATGVNGNAADNSSDSSGAAYVFVRSGGQWQQKAYLKASNTPTVDVPSIGFNDRFGTAVSIGGDGRTVVVGAGGEDGGSTGINGDESDNSRPYSGAAYVFVVNNGVWSQQAYLKASTTSGLRAFGHAVKLNADGNTLAVSAYNPYTDPTTPVTLRGANYDTFFGAVYVFTRSDSAWHQQALLRPSADEFDWHRFGDEIDLSDDGNTLVAYGDDGVYVLDRQGSIWQPSQLLVQSNPETDSNWYSSSAFGHALSISGDGTTVAISWPEESSAATGVQGYQGLPSEGHVFRNTGAAYLFEKLDGRWQQFSYLKAPNSHESLEFGSAISLDSTGDTLAISAINENSSGTGIQGDQSEDTLYGAGAVYLY